MSEGIEDGRDDVWFNCISNNWSLCWYIEEESEHETGENMSNQWQDAEEESVPLNGVVSLALNLWRFHEDIIKIIWKKFKNIGD